MVSQNFVFQNRASRSCKAHLHVSQNFVFRTVHAPYRWSLAGLFAMQTKTPAPTKKRSYCRPQPQGLPIKGSCKLPPQWAEGMPVFVSVPRPGPLSNQPAKAGASRIGQFPPVGVFFIQQAMPPGNRAQLDHGSQWRSDYRP